MVESLGVGARQGSLNSTKQGTFSGLSVVVSMR